MTEHMKTAICPGSFDPVTLGHLDIISRASKIFDRVVVAVPVNPDKCFSFSVEERMDMLQKVCAAQGLENVVVDRVEGLLADYARERSAAVIIKGLRALTDFEYEFQQALTNKKLNPALETMFLSTSAEHMFLSSSMVKWRASGETSPILCRPAFWRSSRAACASRRQSKGKGMR